MQDRLRSRFFHIPSGKYIHSQSLVYNYGCYDLVSTKQQPNGTYYSYILTSFNTSEIIEEQCTGKKDVKGKLVFEGDIIKSPFDGGMIRVIKWCDDAARFLAYSPKNEFNFRGIGDNYLNDFDFEVIGNVNENAEFLENKDE